MLLALNNLFLSGTHKTIHQNNSLCSVGDRPHTHFRRRGESDSDLEVKCSLADSTLACPNQQTGYLLMLQHILWPSICNCRNNVNEFTTALTLFCQSIWQHADTEAAPLPRGGCVGVFPIIPHIKTLSYAVIVLFFLFIFSYQNSINEKRKGWWANPDWLGNERAAETASNIMKCKVNTGNLLHKISTLCITTLLSSGGSGGRCEVPLTAQTLILNTGQLWARMCVYLCVCVAHFPTLLGCTCGDA